MIILYIYIEREYIWRITPIIDVHNTYIHILCMGVILHMYYIVYIYLYNDNNDNLQVYDIKYMYIIYIYIHIYIYVHGWGRKEKGSGDQGRSL